MQYYSKPRLYDIELQILKTINDLSLENNRFNSHPQLAKSIGIQEEFEANMRLLTLECKGLIELTGAGYEIPVVGSQKLQNKLK